MSGPVWEFSTDGPFTCDICLVETDAAYLEGYVEDATFHVIRTLCEECYENNVRLLQKAS